MTHPDHPPTFPRRILLAVTGLSPQIVTETLYALGVTPAQEYEAFLPTEIHLLTTARGAALARTALLHPDGGQFHALLADYPELGSPTFSNDTIHVIQDGHGNALDDIRTPTENASAADTITALIAELTRDQQSALHVSIAGGRKTMGFYLGYAFSLFARPQDQLSHVLVSSPFESHPSFFYPPVTPKRLATRDNHYIDTADAVVTLAHIPVVRLRHGQPEALLSGHASFNDTVQAIQESLDPPHLTINLQTREVRCGNSSVKLSPALTAWLAWWATHRLNGTSAQNWRSADAEEYLAIYRKLIGRNTANYENAENRLKNGMEKSFFDENNSKLRRKLKQQLGPSASSYQLDTTGSRPNTKHFLPIPAQAITLLP